MLITGSVRTLSGISFTCAEGSSAAKKTVAMKYISDIIAKQANQRKPPDTAPNHPNGWLQSAGML
jgi:hypothetical protein